MSEISVCFRRKTCEASSPSISLLPRMDSLPDGIVQYILSKLSNAKDVASCNCVSKKWKDFMSYHKRLCFPCDICDNLTGPLPPDVVLIQMVSSFPQLEELVVTCPFIISGLPAWMLPVVWSLKVLELRVAHDAPDKTWLTLNCIRRAKNLESLRLWCVVMTETPRWEVFNKLRNLEIHGGTLYDSVLTEALRATPNLTRLVVTDCEGLSAVYVELLELQHCQLNFRHSGGCSITLRAPKIQYLEVKGCNRIRVHDTDFLKTLSIHNYTKAFVTMVDLGDNLMALESLSVGGDLWCWDVITKMLQLATQVKHLSLEIDVTMEHAEIDFVDFFKTHPKLKYLTIDADLYGTGILSNNHTTLKNVDSSFVIPCLEEVIITLRSPLISDAKKVTGVVEALLKYGNKLKKININVKAHKLEPGADAFPEEMHRLFQDSTTECHVIR